MREESHRSVRGKRACGYGSPHAHGLSWLWGGCTDAPHTRSAAALTIRAGHTLAR